MLEESDHTGQAHKVEVAAMRELRLIDPDGYTVPGTVHTGFPATAEPELRQRLRVIAEQHAAQWADFGYRAADYRIQTAEPQVAVQDLPAAA